MAQPTAAQAFAYQVHQQTCQALSIPQSTLEHRVLMGSLSVASDTGNQIYSGPGPSTTDLVESQTVKVWLIHTPLTRASESTAGNITEFGRMGINTTRGQCPAIDDYGNPVTMNQDDLVIDDSGTKYYIANPVLDAGISFWSFMMTQQK